MSEGKRRILEMAANGVITEEEAARLLEALGEPDEPKAQETASGTQPISDSKPPESVIIPPAPQRSVPELVITQLEDLIPPELPEEPASVPVQVSAPTSMPAQTYPLAVAPREVVLSQLPPMPQGTGQAYAPCEAPGGNEQAYPNPAYTQEVEEIDISWISGPVEIKVYEGEQVLVTEYCKYPLSEGQKLLMTLVNGKLTIRWSREKVLFGIFNHSKHLVVELPQALAAHLEKLKCSTVSGKIYASGFSGEDITLNSTSGGIYAGGITAETLKLNSVSGVLEVQSVAAENLKADTTSGRIRMDGFAAEEARFNTVSGRIEAYGNAESFKLDSVSGALRLTVEQSPEDANLNSVSGSVEFYLPENTGFTVKYNSMSGRFSTDFPVAGEIGKKKGKVSYKSGDAAFQITTVSGSMKLGRA